MTKSKWYQKRPIADSVLNCIGVKPELFSMLSSKVHIDDMGDVANYLGCEYPILTKVLYKPCEDPGGVKGSFN